tara:strand:- start:480 stop:995 length:516 start_codon:yes stop_codon:yes gene_type:complete
MHSITRANTLVSASTAVLAILSMTSCATAQAIHFDGNELPCIAFNVATAQGAGAPANLTRTTDQATINANRQASCGPAGPTVAALNQQAGAVVFSCDEYPFASSNQGGAGAQIMIVPLIENNIQGGRLGAFYNHNNIGNNGAYVAGAVNVPNAGQLNLGVVNGFNVCYGGQ